MRRRPKALILLDILVLFDNLLNTNQFTHLWQHPFIPSAISEPRLSEFSEAVRATSKARDQCAGLAAEGSVNWSYIFFKKELSKS